LGRLVALVRGRPAAGAGAATDADSSGGVSIPKGVAAGARGQAAPTTKPKGGSTRAPTGSRRGGEEALTYPRLAAGGATQLRCECGKVLTVAAAAASETYDCPVCGAPLAVPDWWAAGSPARGADPAAAPAEPGGEPRPLQWDKLLHRPQPAAPGPDDRRRPARKTGWFRGGGFGTAARSAGRAATVVAVIAAGIIGLAVLTALIAALSSSGSGTSMGK
jgi:hypothetical protein